MVGDTLLFWRIGLFLCKNKGNGSTHSGEREMEQFSLPHICTCCLKLSLRLLAQKQLLTSPSSGSGQGSTSLTMSPFPPPLPAPAADLAQPGAVGTSRPSLWCCWAVHCLFAQGCWAHGCAPDPPLFRAGAAAGCGMGEMRPALLWDKSQG